MFVVNFQGSQAARRFYINLGAQPTFILAEGNRPADPKNQKEYECVFRRRVRGGSWPWDLSDHDASNLAETMDEQMVVFFSSAGALRSEIAAGNALALVDDLPWGVPSARAALHVARACIALGEATFARTVAAHGLRLAGDGATFLQNDLRAITSANEQETTIH